MKLLSCLSILFVAAGCQKHPQEKPLGRPAQANDTVSIRSTLGLSKTISFANNLEVVGSQGEDFGNFTVFERIEVFQDGRLVFLDTTKEYELDHKLFPIFHQLADGSVEIILIVNDRPSKSKGRLLQIMSGKVKRDEVLPEFEGPAKDLNGDGILEYAGLMDYGEVWSDSLGNWVENYLPILYYRQTVNGIMLDSATTMKVNRKIYGTFHGFQAGPIIPYIGRNAFSSELKRIRR